MTQPIHPMLERVARAICAPVVKAALARDWTLCHASDVDALAQRIVDREWPRHVSAARAAIRALLEPDEGMRRAGADELFGSVEDDWTVDARRVFRAMLRPLIGEGE